MRKLIIFIFIFTSLGLINAQTGCKNRYGDTPEDSLRCLENISAFRVYYEAKNYVDAYQSWRKIIDICPMFVARCVGVYAKYF